MISEPPAAVPAPITPPITVNTVGIGYLVIRLTTISSDAITSTSDANSGLISIPDTIPLRIVSATASPCVTAPRSAATPTTSDPWKILTAPAEFTGPNDGEAPVAPIIHDMNRPEANAARMMSSSIATG